MKEGGEGREEQRVNTPCDSKRSLEVTVCERCGMNMKKKPDRRRRRKGGGKKGGERKKEEKIVNV